MSCVRESSPQSEHVSPRPESKRTWNPLRGLRRMFRRNKQPSPEPNEVKSLDDIVEPPGLDTCKSRSTSQLIDEPFSRSRNLHSALKSVSHDSVFNPEQYPGQSDSESAVSIPQMVYPPANIIQAELQEKLRRRRKIQNDDDSDDVDDGLPRSPSMHSPIIAPGNDLLLSKELITKSSHSTCSDGSLLSMDSSEMDEDSLGAHNSRYSSRVSLHDRRPPQNHHQESSDGDSSTSVPLSHSAAKHRMAIRPKRNPRSKKPLTATSALPATPEVNEEHSGRSTSPDAVKPRSAAAAADTSDGTTSASTATSTTTITTTATLTTTTVTTVPDIAVSDDPSCGAAASTRDLDTSIDEISVENVPRREEGFFHRLLSRRSTKKKSKSPSACAEEADVDRFLFDETTGAKPRQREEPPPAGRMQLSYPPDLPPDHPQQPPSSQNYQNVSAIEDIFEPDTFVPIKQSFSLGQQTVDDDTASSSGGGCGSSVDKSLSSDSVSSAVLDEPAENVVELHETTAERCRSYSSSDSEHHGNNKNGYHQRPLPVPAPRLSKLHNGCGGVGPADIVVRRRKRDDQQPELLKVFARRSLKLGQDGEPELLIVAGGGDDSGGGGAAAAAAVHRQENGCGSEETADVAMSENEAVAVILQLADEKKRQIDPEVDVNENRTLTADVPRFKRIQQRREEWEKRLLQQQQN